ncbi:hypothetical protein B0E43_04420 [Algoriphagus sp. A40]|nr:hypothetical protein B0E43_04420 [Algoriphagus sp. A40]
MIQLFFSVMRTGEIWKWTHFYPFYNFPPGINTSLFFLKSSRLGLRPKLGIQPDTGDIFKVLFL